jgi:hypothetical protein
MQNAKPKMQNAEYAEYAMQKGAEETVLPI